MEKTGTVETDETIALTQDIVSDVACATLVDILVADDTDSRSGLLAGKELSQPAATIMNPAPRSLRDDADAVDLLDELRARGIKLLPIIDAAGRLVRIADVDSTQSILPLDALIMAGGRGERARAGGE